MDIKKVGKYLKTKRIEKGYTQGELAEILNVSHQAVSRWEKGDNLPDVYKLSELSKLYSVSIEEILQQDEISSSTQQDDSKVLATLSIVSVIFSLFITILFFSLLISSLSNGTKILILYILIILNVLLYVLPFALKKTPTTLKDLQYIYLGSCGTVFTFFMTIVAVSEGAFGFSQYYVTLGLVYSGISLLIHYFIFNSITTFLFRTKQNKFMQMITSLNQEQIRSGITSFVFAFTILSILYVFTGYLEFLIFTIGVLASISLLVMVIRNFNIFSFIIGSLYFLPFGMIIFYMTNANTMSFETWTSSNMISSYYEDSIGIIVFILLMVFILLYWVYKEYFRKYATTIYITSTFFILQVFSITFASPTYRHIKVTNNNFIAHYYHFDFELIRASVFQVLLFTIIIHLFRQIYREYKTWSLNKAD